MIAEGDAHSVRLAALYMLRYHSFYPAHRERDYEYLMNARDKAMFDQVRAFNPYDLYQPVKKV